VGVGVGVGVGCGSGALAMLWVVGNGYNLTKGKFFISHALN
jgi:hypothetical protein